MGSRRCTDPAQSCSCSTTGPARSVARSWPSGMLRDQRLMALLLSRKARAAIFTPTEKRPPACANAAAGPIWCHRRQQTSSRTRSDRSPAHPIAEVKHPVALNHHVRFLQQVLRADRPEVALAGPEHHGYDVHAHLVDQARGKHLATDVAGGDLDHAVSPRKLL